MTGRGLIGVGADQALLGRLNFSLDIFRSLEILAKHPRVDPDRIILMGFSRGGQGALYSSVSRFQKMWNKSGIDFAAYVIFYPDCGTIYREDGIVQARPIRIFHGTPDDYNPVRSCKAYAERLKSARTDITIPSIQTHRMDMTIRWPPTPARQQRPTSRFVTARFVKMIRASSSTPRPMRSSVTKMPA